MAQLIKTLDGTAIASVKTVDGTAISSVKTFDGIDNSSGGVCTKSSEFQDNKDDQYSTSAGNNTDQAFKQPSSGVSVCKVKVYFENAAGNVTLRIRTASNGGGLVLATSDTVNVTGAGDVDFTFAANVAAAADGFINATSDATMAIAVTTAGAYRPGYQVFTGATGNNWAWDFELWTLQ